MFQDQYNSKIKKRIIKVIQTYPDLFKSHTSVVAHMLVAFGTGYEWDKNGNLINPIKEHRRKPRLSIGYARSLYIYGYQRDFVPYCNFCKEYSPIFNIPTNISKHWLKVIKDFVIDINNINLHNYKIELRAYYVRDPKWYNRSLKEFNELRKYTNTIEKKYGWKKSSIHGRHEVQALIKEILRKLKRNNYA